MRLTFKAEGQDIQCTAITIRKLGTVAQNLVTIRIYHDVQNDTYNRLDGDDVELAQAEAGPFITNAITFHPNFWVTIGTDYNVVIAFSLGLLVRQRHRGFVVRLAAFYLRSDLLFGLPLYRNFPYHQIHSLHQRHL